MKKSILTTIIVCFASGILIQGSLSAQSPTFRKSYDVTLFDIAGGMVEATTGDFLFAGGGIQAILTNIDDTGVVQWSKNYNSGFVAQFNDLKKVSTGGYILCGSSSGDGAILTRIDVNGNLIWSKRYEYPDGGGESSNEYAYAVIETSDGGFLVGGGVDYFWDGVSAGTLDTSNAMGFKVDVNGNLLWNIVWPMTNSIQPDEHYINDVAESSDGYFFVGESADETQSYDSDGDLPRDALLIKTNKTGTTQYIRRWGHGNSTWEGINSAKTLTLGANAGKILLGGYDDTDAFLITVDGTGGTPTLGAFNRRIYDNAFLFPDSYILTEIMENPDGNYCFLGTQFEFAAMGLNTIIVKVNSSSGAILFGKSYAPIGLSSLLPRGGIAADGGYFTSQLDQQFTGFNFNVIRTDANGDIGVSVAGCIPTNFGPTATSFSPGLSTPATAEYYSMTASATVPVITNVSPTQSVHCIDCVTSADAGNNATICQGSSTNLLASGGGSGGTYAWSPATGLSCTNCANPVANPGTTTTYTVTVSNAAGCSGTDNVTVTVIPAPSATASNNGPVCIGSTLTLAGGVNGMSSYSWTGPNSFSSSTQSPTVSGSATPAMSGTYTLTISDGTCTNTASTVVTVTALPTATASNNGPVCIGSSLDLTGGSGGMSSYSWTGPNSFSSSTQSPNVSGSATPAMAGTYTLIISDGVCTNTATTNVTINSLPNPNLGADVGTCVGQGITITASGGGTYSWSPTSDLSCTTCANPIASPASTTTYTVTVTDANGCSASEDITVNIYTAPPADAGLDVNICSGVPTNLSATGAGAGGTYQWSPGTGLSATNISNPVANPTITTTYTVTVTDIAGCSATDDITVTVNPLPAADAGSNVTICIGDSTTLNATGGISCVWSPDSSLNYDDIYNPVATPLVTTTYVITVTDGNGCVDTDNVTVTVNTPSADAGSDVSICMGSSTILIASGGTSYVWNPGTGLSSTTVANPTANPTTTTNYVVTVTNASGCTATDDVTVTVNPLPTANAGTDATICNGTSTSLAAIGGSTYSWSPGNGLSATNISNPVANPADTTVYTVTVTDANGCTDSDNVTVNVNPAPVAYAGIDQAICLSEIVVLTANGGGSYNWSTTDTTATISYAPSVTTTYMVTVSYANGCSDSDDVIVTVNSIPTVTITSDPPDFAYLGQIVTFTALPDGYDVYNFYVDGAIVQTGSSNIYQTNSLTNNQVVSVSATDLGCESDTDTLTYEIKPIPNAFTPYDLNGKNDIFVKGLDMTIFNRWNQIIYEGIEGWDGKYNGALVSAGTYYYIIKIKDLTNVIVEINGSVTVVNNAE